MILYQNVYDVVRGVGLMVVISKVVCFFQVQQQ